VDANALYLAVDLGAGSGRVFLVGLAPGELLLEETRRFQYPPRFVAGHLRWDFQLILREIIEGLRTAAGRAAELRRPIASVGIDSWGVDYGLIDAAGTLVEDPICYRDDRTDGMMEQVFARVPRSEIFARTGIQFLRFNTLYQLFAHVASGLPGNAAHLLLVPDLVASQLTGCVAAEYTNATTTQIVSATNGTWDVDLLERLGLPARLLPRIVRPGTAIARLSPAVAATTGLDRLPVIAVATHDTGSAVAGTPLDDSWAYVSSGTWSLVGIERNRPLITEAVERENFTNEGGACGTTRFLKNVMGLWILESCRREWTVAGHDVSYGSLFGAASTGPMAVIYPDDPRLLNPGSMPAALARQIDETGQAAPTDPVAMTRTIIDSLALRYASVLRGIQALTGTPIRGVRIVGGGSRNEYLNQATATFTGTPVVAGPAEATVIGNACVQAVAAGRFASLRGARRHVAARSRPARFAPHPDSATTELTARYAAIEARFSRA
jgi:rhamnulokinase